MENATLALILSSASIGISITSLIWSVYAEIFLRPLTTTSAQIGYIFHNNQEFGPYITIHTCNKGPGKLQISNITYLTKRSLKDVIKKKLYRGTIVHDWENPYNPQLLTDIERYETYSQTLKYGENCFLSENIKKLGFIDSMNRYHWVRKKDIRELNKKYKEKYLFDKKGNYQYR